VINVGWYTYFMARDLQDRVEAIEGLIFALKNDINELKRKLEIHGIQ
jgi:hypothetical protein